MITRRARPARERDEEGLTLIELLIAMTILGIVMTTITGVLITALRMAPDQQGRSQFASQSQVFVDQLSDDIANAKTLTDIPIASANTTTCATPGTLGNGTPWGWKSLYYMALVDGSAVLYDLQIAPIAGTSNYMSVTVHKVSGTDSVVLQAYCHTGDPVVTVSYTDPTYTLDLNVMTAYPNGETRHIAFTALRRAYSP